MGCISNVNFGFEDWNHEAQFGFENALSIFELCLEAQREDRYFRESVPPQQVNFGLEALEAFMAST